MAEMQSQMESIKEGLEREAKNDCEVSLLQFGGDLPDWLIESRVLLFS